MKIRNGWVSNSSSSSFLIYGIYIDENEFNELNLSRQKLRELGLASYCPEYSEVVYIGTSWDTVGDEETGNQFKWRIENKLKEALGSKYSESTLGTHEEVWYNG